MKYSYNWLKELSKTKKLPEQLAELLTMRAFEVESVEKIKGDSVLEIKVLPDRGHDALSHIGMAREIAALEGRELKYKFKKLPSLKAKNLSVKIQDKKLCSRYIGAIIENIEIKESPEWIKVQLENLGMNSINNIVDATNYVMLELGQPLHAFDISTLATRNLQLEIIVRKAKDREEIKLLDGSVKKLTSEDLVIADSERALAIAGIKGGVDAEINISTKMIVLEAANFNSIAIRKSRMRLGLPTDAAMRFEKEIDPNLAELAMARVIEIIEMFGGVTQEIADAYPSKIKDWKIKLNLDYVNKLLGENVPAVAVKKILNSLGLKISGAGKTITVIVPTFRVDLKTQEDLVEEIGRIYGYEKVRSQTPKVDLKAAEINSQRLFERKAKNILGGIGFLEVYNYSFYGERDAEFARLEIAKHLKLENPLNPDQALLRVSLIPGILKNIYENLKHFKDFRIFESGRVYEKNSGALPNEKRMLVGAVVLENQKDGVFYETKGCIESLLNNLGIEGYYFEAKSIVDDLWHAGRSAEIKIGQKTIGRVGEINPQVLEDFGIQKRIACFEFDLDTFQKNAALVKTYKTISKYPAIIRDISMMAQNKIKVADIIKNIRKNGGTLVQNIELFDIFQKENKNSFAFHIKFGANRTLESREVDAAMQKIIQALEKYLGVEIRK